MKQIYKPRIIWHVLWQVGEQKGCSKANIFGRIMESVRELMEVNFAILVGINAHHDVFYFLSVW